ncbi:MAG: ParB N-terminal domain-containing protein [Parcubacteria group bacterium]|nr:ParB N-terminal domain-containing protein [Parcubacteria group bacterium]
MLLPIKTIPISQLKPHEQICPDHLLCLQQKISRDRIFTHPIVIDRTTKIILDGHHRCQALKRLGHAKIPCILVNYRSCQVAIKSRCHQDIDKETVIKHALRGKLLRPKATKHYLRLGSDQLIPFEKIKTNTKIPLSQLI